MELKNKKLKPEATGNGTSSLRNYLAASVIAAGLAILPSCATTQPKSTTPVKVLKLKMSPGAYDARLYQSIQEQKAADAIAKEAGNKTKPSTACDLEFDSVVAITPTDPISRNTTISISVLTFTDAVAPYIESLKGAKLSVEYFKGGKWIPVPGCEALSAEKETVARNQAGPGSGQMIYYTDCDFSKAIPLGMDMAVRAVFLGRENVCASYAGFEYSFRRVQ